MLKTFLIKNKRTITAGSIGAFLGATAGFLYWKFVGCISGTCAIWTNPIRATLYGGIMGALIVLIIVPEQKNLTRKGKESES
jgi:phage shock protein E